ncbi:hypothetical protein SLE2022_232480 [Rubroshorea leprosula]
MKGKGMDEDGLTREINEETAKVTEESTGKRYTKKIILSVYHWGGEKVFILKRFKHKVSVYVIACIPLRFKECTSLISA